MDDIINTPRSGKESRGTLSGLVRMVSLNSKPRDGSSSSSSKYGNINRSTSSRGFSSSSSSNARYRNLSSDSTSKATSTPPRIISSSQEHIVWGPPPAIKTNRTVEGIELADETIGMNSLMNVRTNPSPKKSSVGPRPSTRATHRAISPAPFTGDIEELTEIDSPDRLLRRRSIDSLLPSIHSHIHLPAYSELDFPSVSLDSSIPQRSDSIRKHSASRKGNRHSISISSTARAKPAREGSLPDISSSPYQGFWTIHRSDDDVDKENGEGSRLRELFRNKGPLWAVSRGWKKGIFLTFEEAEKQTRNFPGPLVRQFATVDEAVDFLDLADSSKAQGIVDEDKDYATRFAITAMKKPNVQRQYSAQSMRGSSSTELNRVLRSPSTNPFLNRAENLQLPWGGLRSVTYAATSSIPLLVSMEKAEEQAVISTDDDMASENGFQTPTSVPDENRECHHFITTIFSCQNLESSIEFYTGVLGFRVLEGKRHQEQVNLAYKNYQEASLTLRRNQSHLEAASSTILPSSNLRNCSCLISVSNESDLKQLFSTVKSNCSSLEKLKRGSQPHLTAIETTPWATFEFTITDSDGNQMIFSAI